MKRWRPRSCGDGRENEGLGVDGGNASDHARACFRWAVRRTTGVNQPALLQIIAEPAVAILETENKSYGIPKIMFEKIETVHGNMFAKNPAPMLPTSPTPSEPSSRKVKDKFIAFLLG